MKTGIRAATTADVEGVFHVRTAVKENALSRAQLAEMGITPQAVGEMIAAAPCAWVACDGDRIVGFSMILPGEGCLFAAFVLPAYEGQGIGKRLVAVAEEALFRDRSVIWLETGSRTRAAGFYRHTGWSNETDIGDGDIRLEKHRA